ncbi:MAG TPA: hypothetical protein VFU80_08555 [Sphingomicrobium sp.]|nr:hypothetical protein [Sphingomicrobium sp.]
MARKTRRYPVVEWLSAAIGLAVTAGMFGFLVVESVRQRGDVPPVMEVAAVGLVAGRDTYVVEAEVKNISRKTAAQVQVEGLLKRGDAPVETSNATVDYVPGGSSRQIGLVFTHDPRTYRLELRVTGYERP